MLNPWYITGLVDGEGCFCITISKHKTKKLGFDPRLMFEIEMIIDDEKLLRKLKDHFKCGHVYILNYERYGWRPHVKYAVKKQKDIIEKIIPFF
ncbi:LAGLIDADG family homing endonuclease [Patescibacteria group bacterium]|nr:LAGLIDADG family homing endonuclease [Patescibacteria group bacterium]MBU2035896.1 LAGLIDADG family homing endonuclease [Patescibacteria group bacterium]